MLFDEFCECRCHTSGNIKYIVACCHTCSYCHKKVKTHAYVEHQKECSDKHDPKINGVRLTEILSALKTLEDADIDITSISAQVSKLFASALSEE
jgi:hypothetical protein